MKYFEKVMNQKEGSRYVFCNLMFDMLLAFLINSIIHLQPETLFPFSISMKQTIPLPHPNWASTFFLAKTQTFPFPHIISSHLISFVRVSPISSLLSGFRAAIVLSVKLILYQRQIYT